MFMKKLTFFLLSVCVMAQGFAANKYWVGMSGANWGDTSSWSDISPVGASGAAVPANEDNVFFETGSLTVNLTAHDSVNSITFTYSDILFSGAAITTNSMTISSCNVTFVDGIFINSELTFLGVDSKITNNASINGKSVTLGNGGAFTLTGNSETNYFTGNTNAYYIYNTTSPLTVYFNPKTTTAGGIVVKSGLITLGNNINTWRLNLSATTSQELILGENVTLTLSGSATTTSNFSLLSIPEGGAVNASAAGSKFSIKAKSPTILTATTKRIFKENSTINELEFNSNNYTLTLQQAIRVRTLTLTAGTIDNTAPNSITIVPSGSVVYVAGSTTADVIYGSETGVNTASILNAQVFVNAQNEIVISAPENSNYAIYSAVGQLIAAGKLINNLPLTINNSKGVYLVKVNDEATRVIIK